MVVKQIIRLCKFENIKIAFSIVKNYDFYTLIQTIRDLFNNRLPYSKAALDLYIKNTIHPNDYLVAYSVNNIDDINEAVRSFLDDGKKSAEKIKLLCEQYLSSCTPPVSLLEFASGYGRVTRYLDKKFFDVTACDIHSEAVKFIKDKFNAKAILSGINPDNFDLKTQYNVVFALSFFSHMPDKTFGKWLKVLYDHVCIGGMLIFTTHGRLANELQKMDLIDGYAFEPVSEQADLDYAEYGMTITEQSYVDRVCDSYLCVKPDVFIEGFWWDCQDLYIIFK